MRQLTSLDAQFLAIESRTTTGHVGGLAIFDSSTAPGGRVTLEDTLAMLRESVTVAEIARGLALSVRG